MGDGNNKDIHVHVLKYGISDLENSKTRSQI